MPTIERDAPEVEIPPAEVLPPSVPGLPPPGATAMQLRGSYVTAVSVLNPRSLHEVERKLLEEANLMGEDAFYGWGAGDNRIEGKSDALAHAAARCWGNCAVEFSPPVETDGAFLFTAHFIDLESGFTLSRPFRQSKEWVVPGKMDPVRKMDVRFAIGASKAARNVILKALPSWLLDKAFEKAKSGVRERLEKLIQEKGIVFAQDAAIKALAKEGVSEAAVLAKYGATNRAGLDLDRLVMLRGDLSQIQAGRDRAAELFPEPERVQEQKSRVDDLRGDRKAPADVPADPPPTSAPPVSQEPASAPEASGASGPPPGEGSPASAPASAPAPSTAAPGDPSAAPEEEEAPADALAAPAAQAEEEPKDPNRLSRGKVETLRQLAELRGADADAIARRIAGVPLVALDPSLEAYFMKEVFSSTKGKGRAGR